MALDWVLAAYVAFVALVAIVWAVPWWPYILGGHAAIVAGLLLLPPRGAAWEQGRAADSCWLSGARSVARFLRYTYPALLLTPFFEEVSLTVNAAAVDAPYWFEHDLFDTDRTLFGGTPAVMLSQAGNPVLDEIMHAFYFSYFLLIIGGIVFAWNGGRRGRGTPGRGFHTAMTCMMLGFFLSYVWYPFLPARGPWEHPEVMAGLRPFGGWVFTRAIEWIIAGAAVSGGCFPSAHVSGAWALTFGMYATDRRAAIWFGLLAVGLSIACVYTRYHHAVDVLAGLTVAAVAAIIGFGLTRHLPPQHVCVTGLPTIWARSLGRFIGPSFPAPHDLTVHVPFLERPRPLEHAPDGGGRGTLRGGASRSASTIGTKAITKHRRITEPQSTASPNFHRVRFPWKRTTRVIPWTARSCYVVGARRGDGTPATSKQ